MIQICDMLLMHLRIYFLQDRPIFMPNTNLAKSLPSNIFGICFVGMMDASHEILDFDTLL